ncbi:MAG TPA: hypothetical protein DCK95_02690 [Anaerolineaceae bacterium]|nr:hypothetical protein [Anaerolineaceae bacterium]
MYKKKLNFLLIVVLIGALALTGCSAAETVTAPPAESTAVPSSSGETPTEVAAPTQPQEMTTIQFMQWWGTEGDVGKSLDGLVADFEDENPNIKVELVSLPFGDTKTQIVANHVAGTIADVIGVNPPWTREFYDLGILEPLDNYMANDAGFNKADYFPASMTPIDGKTYLAPYNTLTFLLYYNIDMFESAGLEVPQNWNDILTAASALTDVDNNKYGFTLSLSEAGAANGSILSLYPLLYAANGRTLVDGKYNAETPEMIAAMKLLSDLSAAGSIVPGENVKNDAMMVEEFSLGNVGMMIQSDAHVASLAVSNPDLNYGVIPIPSPDGNGKPELRHHGWDLAMTAKGKNKEAAWKFISFLLQRDNMERAGIEMHKTPSMFGIAVADGASEPEKMVREYMSTYNMVEELMSMPKAGACWEQLTKAGVYVLKGEKTPEQALADTQTEWNSILEQ